MLSSRQLWRSPLLGRAFTLIELSYVLVIISLLTAVTVPAYDLLVRRAQAAEATSMVHAIASAERQRYRDQGAYLACPAEGDVPALPRAFPAAPCWEALGIRVTDPVRYRYSVALEGDSFVVTAEGDLDRDGVAARYTLRGRDLHLDVVEPLE